MASMGWPGVGWSGLCLSLFPLQPVGQVVECTNGCGRPSAPNRPQCWGCYSSKSRNGTTARKRPDNGKRYESPIERFQESILAIGDTWAAIQEGEQVDPAQWQRLLARARMSYIRFRRWSRQANTANKGTNTGG